MKKLALFFLFLGLGFLLHTQALAIAVQPQVAAARRHTVGLKSDGTMLAMGNNDYGQCNVGSWTDILQVAAGDDFTVGLKSDGTVLAEGLNDYGQLNVSDWTNIVNVATGWWHTVGVKSDGKVVAVGTVYGGLNVSGWTDIVQVDAGLGHTVGLKSNGTVLAVGNNGLNQCNVSGWTDVVQVVASWRQTVGLKSDGTVLATGDNTYGGLDVSGWTDIVEIAVGCCHTVGLKTDGTVSAIGNNDHGQLNVSDWTGIVKVAAGWYNTFGLKADGTVLAAGYNGCGMSDLFDWNLQLNLPPIADAGPNAAITSENKNLTILSGTATDPNNDMLSFRWLEGTSVLLDWQNVGLNREAVFNFNIAPHFSIGEHTLTLEVDDGKAISRDDMILTVNNSAPHPAPAGGGTYEISTPVILNGQVADFDGELLNYQWLNGDLLITSGQIQAIYGGDPVNLPESTTSFNTVGPKIITLQVNDGVNPPVSKSINVNVIDTSAPTLAPIPNKTILWPPNHQMVGITIQANASDNSGNPVSLTASVGSNEPIDGLGDGDTAPDWTQPVINQQTGVISLQLRAERSGSGSGRIYTVSIIATDQSGNSSTADVKIVVPHDNRKK